VFEVLEHPADIGFRAFGSTPAELFRNAALALLSISAELEDIRPLQEYPLAASGADYESLLVNWLNEVLYFTDGKRLGLCEFRIEEMDATHVAATGLGEPNRFRARLIVKAATYHQLKVAQTASGWVAEVYLDI